VTKNLVLMLIATILGHGTMTSAETPSESTRVVMEETMVPAKDPGTQIYVRNKHLADFNHSAPAKTVLFVHGATYPAETSFDLPLDGLSWMDYIARRGYDVYLMDVRGYGRSTRPPEMNEPADEHPPIADTDTAVRDVSAVVDYILTRRGIRKLDLLGWSWGTAIMATYTASNPEKVERLVLYAPVWFRETPSLALVSGPVGSYRTVTRDAAFNRWMTGVPDQKKVNLIPAGWFDQWWNATLATDPDAARQDPPALRAPNGSVQDGRTFWSAGKATYDPARITVPILLIQAEWDQDTPPYMSRALFPLLVNAPEKRYVMIGEGTHHVMLEKNRMELFREVQAFLDEGAPADGKPSQTSPQR
jgi:pimeloyl-ACP methyl ester carboxylesterase